MTQLPGSDADDFPEIPDDGKRYEIIDGEEHVSDPTDIFHQSVSGEMVVSLSQWSRRAGRGVAAWAPGIIFSDGDEVAPDCVWISHDRFRGGLDQYGHLRVAPELMVEVLSPNAADERRDRELKLRLYSRQGVREYWIVDWQRRTIDVYRRDGDLLGLVATLRGSAVLESPLLPGYSLTTSDLFADLDRLLE